MPKTNTTYVYCRISRAVHRGFVDALHLLLDRLPRTHDPNPSGSREQVLNGKKNKVRSSYDSRGALEMISEELGTSYIELVATESGPPNIVRNDEN